MYTLANPYPGLGATLPAYRRPYVIKQSIDYLEALRKNDEEWFCHKYTGALRRVILSTDSTGNPTVLFQQMDSRIRSIRRSLRKAYDWIANSVNVTKEYTT